MKHLILIVSLCYTLTITAQIPQIEWKKIYGGTNGDYAESIQKTADGGYILAGATYSNDGDVSGNHGGNGDFWVIKINAAGTLEWQKCLGGSKQDLGFAVQQTQDGGYAVAGYTSSVNGDVFGLHGTVNDYWIVKLDAVGNIEWQKCLGGSSADSLYSMKTTPDGGYILAGSSISNNGDVTGHHGNGDYWVVKLDTLGNLTWQKTLGGSLEENGQSIALTADGGYIVTGYSKSNDGDVTNNHNPGTDDVWVVKLTSNGAIEWQKALGGSGGDYSYSIIQSNDGGYVIGGETASNNGDVTHSQGDTDSWIVKLDANGNLQWQKTYGGTSYEYLNDIKQTSDGGYIAVGSTDSQDGDLTTTPYGMDNGWVFKIDAQGELLWQKTIGGSGADYCREVVSNADGGFTIGGWSRSNDFDVTGGDGSGNFWIVKFTEENLSTSHLSKDFIKIFPNPTQDWLHVSSDLKIDNLSVIDHLGNIVLKSVETQEINIAKLAQGTYILQINSGQNFSQHKFIKL